MKKKSTIILVIISWVITIGSLATAFYFYHESPAYEARFGAIQDVMKFGQSWLKEEPDLVSVTSISGSEYFVTDKYKNQLLEITKNTKFLTSVTEKYDIPVGCGVQLSLYYPQKKIMYYFVDYELCIISINLKDYGRKYKISPDDYKKLESLCMDFVRNETIEGAEELGLQETTTVP